MVVDSFGNLVDLGDEERSGTGDPQLDRAVVVRVEGADGEALAVDERAFEALGATCRSLAV